MAAGEGLSRRELLAAGAVGATAAIGATAATAAPSRWRTAFTGEGDGWPGWTTHGVANLRRTGGLGLLEAGSDVFPHDPRPVAFAVDRRFADGEVVATIERPGAGAGVVVRRTGPQAHYAAVLHEGALRIVLRRGAGLVQLARRTAIVSGPLRLTLAATGTRPTLLTARLEPASGPPVVVTARDATPALQAPGDPGVLATAETLLPSQGPPVLPALGNLHLLPYSTQEGQAVLDTAVGELLLGVIRERSTAAFSAIEIRTAEPARPTLPSAVAATTGAPVTGGAFLRVATDVPARVRIEVSADRRFRRSRVLRSRLTGDFGAVLARAGGLPPGRTVHWRPRMRRRGIEVVGPASSFRVLPRAGSGEPVRVAVGSCAAQFGPAFDVLTARDPDVFVWQGDLNYPDTAGPLAQTLSGYAGIWREFLANPRLEALLARTAFAVQRDDHDFGVQDANEATLVPWGLAPWNALMEARPYYRFTAGAAEFWVLDQRQFKSDPGTADGPAKTLLGAAQRAWLLRTLAASPAAFKVICSPCTLAPLAANARDGSWAAGFEHERDLLLAQVTADTGATTLFVTGDTHWTMVYDRDGLFEARPCPLGIPTPNDITLVQPRAAQEARGRPGVAYADDQRGHFAQIDVSGDGSAFTLELSLVRDDGAVAHRRTFRRPR